MDKTILRDITYGMYIVSSGNDEIKAGCIINTLTQITSDNPIVTISLNKNNYTNQIIKQTKKAAISILSEKVNPNLIATFGFKSSSEIDKFANFKYQNINGIPVILDEVVGYIIGDVLDIIDCETHDIFIIKLTDSKKLSNLKPMTYTYYHEVIKGKAPKNAPTYVEEDIVNTKEEIYVCDVCGYVHKGPLPDNFVCPICGVDVSHFKAKN